MSLPTITPSHVFGLNTEVRNNACFVDDVTICYPAGSQIVQYNIEQKTQKIGSISNEPESISAMAVHLQTQMIAVAIRGDGGDKPASIQLCDLGSTRKRKNLNLHETNVKTREFISIGFSFDGRFVFAQGSAPDWHIYVWLIEKLKLVANTKTTNHLNTELTVMSCSPFEATQTQLCVAGSSIFRIYKFHDNSLKMSHQTKVDKLIRCVSWVNDNRIVAGTKESRILVIEAGELMVEMTYQLPQAGLGIPSPEVSAIEAYDNGLLIGLDTGVVVSFRKTDDQYYYKKNREIALEEASVSQIALNPHDEMAVVTLKNNQIYKLTFEGDSQNEEIKSDRLGDSFHTGSITGLDTCLSKPLIVTSGADQSLRIWNYLDNCVEVVKYCDEAALSVALHPNGLYMLAAFPSGLKLMAILIDDIRTFWESASFRNCKECRFSTGGQYFACIWNSSIVVCDTWNFDIVANLKGDLHSRVDKIEWSNDDTKILAYSHEGTITVWNVYTKEKEYELLPIQGDNYKSGVLSNTGRAVYGYTGDYIKTFQDGKFQHQIQCSSAITNLFASHFGEFMVSVTRRGTINAHRYPFEPTSKFLESQEYTCHAGLIHHACFSGDDQHFFTVGEDGCLFIYRIQDKEKKTRIHRELVYSDEILVSRSDLIENQRIFVDLKQKVEELRQQSDLQLKSKEELYATKLQEVIDKFKAEIKGLHEVIDLRKMEMNESDARRKQEMSMSKEHHQLEIKETKEGFEQKITSESSRYNELLKKLENLRLHSENKLQDIDATYHDKVAKISDFYTQQLDAKTAMMEQTRLEFEDHRAGFEKNLKSIEEDIEQEILGLQYQYELRLKEEGQLMEKVRAENTEMKAEYDRLMGLIEDHKRELMRAINEEKRIHEIIKTMEQDIAGLIKEVQEREETLMDKDKRIYDLRKKNQELEKFKFVLDFKIMELRKQVQPREEDYKLLKVRKEAMEIELRDYRIKEKELQTQFEDLLLKHFGSCQERMGEQWRREYVEMQQANIDHDVKTAFKALRDIKEVKKQINILYQKYRNGCPEPPETAPLDQMKKMSKSELLYHIENIGNQKSAKKHQEVKDEVNQQQTNQRMQLEGTARMLRNNLQKEIAKRTESAVKMTQETMFLTKELNLLKKDLAFHEKRFKRLVEARNQGITLKQFLQMELADKSIPDQLRTVLPPLPGGILNKTAMPIPGVLPQAVIDQ